MGNDEGRSPSGTQYEDDRQIIRLPRQRLNEAPEQPAVRRGAKPGERIVRLQRPSERRFRSEEPGTLRATDVATQPRTSSERAWRSIRRVLLGAPLSTEVQEEQRLSKVKALAVFSSDALSSSAYATDEILIVLAAAGAGALSYSVPIALVIARASRDRGLLLPPDDQGLSKRRRRLHRRAREPGRRARPDRRRIAPVDYVLTVAVSIAAGVFAITSAFPEFAGFEVEIALARVLLITWPTCAASRSRDDLCHPDLRFIVSFVLLIGVGLLRVLADPG